MSVSLAKSAWLLRVESSRHDYTVYNRDLWYKRERWKLCNMRRCQLREDDPVTR